MKGKRMAAEELERLRRKRESEWERRVRMRSAWSLEEREEVLEMRVEIRVWGLGFEWGLRGVMGA